MAASTARGLRVIQAVQGYMKGHPNCFDTSTIFNKIKLFDVGDERACARFTVEQQMCNVSNTLHGGYMVSVIDALTVVQLLAIKLFDVGDERACARFTVEQQMCNVSNTLHGGYMVSVIDALTVVQLLAVRDGRLAWTTNLNVHFLNAASLGEQVTVETTPIRITNRSILVEARAASDTTGLIVAKALNTFMFGHEKIQKAAENLFQLDFSHND